MTQFYTFKTKIASLLLLFSFLAYTSTAQVIDVDNSTGGPGAALGVATGEYQSFTCGISGDLTRVDVNIKVFDLSGGLLGVPSGTFQINIRDGEGLGGAVLATGPSLLLTSQTFAWQTLNFGTPATLISGNKYTLEFIVTFANSPIWGVQMQNNDATYAGGHYFSGGVQTYDQYFKTYILAPVTSTIWEAPGVWNPAAPDASTDATIDFLYDINTNIVSKNLTINAGKSLEVQPGFSVTVEGDLTNNGNLTLKSPANLTASGSLITKGTVTNNGTMLAQRNIMPDRWHLLASPLDASISAILPFNMDYVYTYDEPYSGIENDDAWTQLPSFGANIMTDMGYLVKSAAADNSDFVIPFEGTFRTGNVIYSNLSFMASGYNLVANPYPSAIDWNAAGWTKTAVGGSTWIWNSTQYAVWDGAIGTNGATKDIPAMQAFFVQVNNATNTLGMTNAVRLHSTASIMRNNPPPTDLKLVRLAVSGNNLTDDIVLYDAQDNEDSNKFFSSTNELPQLYSIENDKKLAINKLQNQSDFDVDLGFVCGISGNYTISATEFTYDRNTTVILEDLVTGTEINLSQNTTYTFAYTQGEQEQRFILHFNRSTVGIATIADTNISIYAAEKTIFINSKTLKNGNVSIFNTLGQEVFTSQLTKQITPNLPNGLYIVKVKTANQEATKQVFIN